MPKIHYVSVNSKGHDTFCGVPSRRYGAYHSRMKPTKGYSVVQPQWARIAEGLMKDQNLTQEALIDTFQVTTRGSVGHYFKGRRQPTIDQIMRLAKRLGVTTSQLVGEIPLAADSQETREAYRLLSEATGLKRRMLLDILRVTASNLQQESDEGSQ